METSKCKVMCPNTYYFIVVFAASYLCGMVSTWKRVVQNVVHSKCAFLSG